MKTEKKKVALVGCGHISALHLSALTAREDVYITALCDTDAEKARTAAVTYAPSAALYTDFKTMINEVRPYALHICTPHYLHAPMAIYALRHGVNVFLEKPLAVTAAEADALIAAEKESTARLCVCFQNRENPTTKEAHRLAEEDGGVKAAYASVFWHRDEAYYKSGDWRGKYATEGGGVMINQAIHTLDLLCEFLGEPTEVTATTANHHLRGIIEVEDTCEGIIRFTDGKQANFYATTAGAGADATDILLMTEHEKIRLESPYLYVCGRPAEIAEAGTRAGCALKECYGGGHKTLIDLFYRALADGAPMPVTAESAKRSLDILLAAYRSDGEPVSLK